MNENYKTRKAVNITVSVNPATRQRFEELCSAAEANSKGEFLNMLMDFYTQDASPVVKEKIVEKIIEKNVEIPVQLKDLEIIVQLSQVHFEILKELAENENQILLINSFFSSRENFTKYMFQQINESDDLKTKIAKILVAVFAYIEINGPHDMFFLSQSRRHLRTLIEKYHPETKEPEGYV